MLDMPDTQWGPVRNKCHAADRERERERDAHDKGQLCRGVPVERKGAQYTKCQAEGTTV